MCIVVSCLVCIVVVLCVLLSVALCVLLSVVLCVLLSSYVYLFYYVCIVVFTLDADCWLEVRIRKVLRPATSTQVFLGFPVSKSKC